MGCRSCEKPNVHHRKGLWSPEEDQRLKDCILKHGHGCWSSVPAKAGLQRNGKSCRLRWINYLRPGLKRGIFSAEEEETVINLHSMLGNKWSQIAMHLPGRTDNEVKNYWNTYLKKRVVKIEAANPHIVTTPSLNSNSQSSKPEQLPQELNDQLLAFKYLETLESSSAESSHPIIESNDHGTSKGTLPKIMFADWLPMDQGNEDTFANLNISMSWHSNVEEVSRPGSLQVEEQQSGGFLHGFVEDNIYGEFQFQPQLGSAGTQASGFFDLLTPGDMGDNFDSHHDPLF